MVSDHYVLQSLMLSDHYILQSLMATRCCVECVETRHQDSTMASMLARAARCEIHSSLHEI